MAMDPGVIAEESLRRYYNDPVHHARVEVVVGMSTVALDLGDREQKIAKMAASFALVLATLDPVTGEPS